MGMLIRTKGTKILAAYLNEEFSTFINVYRAPAIRAFFIPGRGIEVCSTLPKLLPTLIPLGRTTCASYRTMRFFMEATLIYALDGCGSWIPEIPQTIL